ncbi:MAG TPA: hypothetical protein PK720_03585 [bacterium]|nr:hypothetical protein [bacterium]
MNNKKIKIVYIAHPISGAVEDNIEKVKEICKKYLDFRIFPYAPYLASLLYLDNESFRDLSLGMAINKLFFQRRFIDELWLFGDRISSGMEQEIEWAFEYNIPIFAKTPETKKALKELRDKIKKKERK